MKKSKSFISFVLIAIFTSFAVFTANAQEVKVNKNDLPPAVTKAFQTAYPNAKIIGTAKETEKNVTYFEIESKDGKIRRDLLYTKDGKIAEIEEALTSETIPVFVKTSIEKKFPKVEFKSGEKNVRNSLTKYEVVIEASEVKYEVVCDSNGEILKTTKLKDEDGKESDND